MTHPDDLFKRVCAANPVPVDVEPDWDRVIERLQNATDPEADRDHLGSADAPRSAPATPRLPDLGLWRRAHRSRAALLGSVLCAAAVAGVVMAIAPWSGSSDFLARAAAALAPQAGTILHERWELTIKPEPGNPFRTRRVTFGPEQLWMQTAPPHRYRTILQPGEPAMNIHVTRGSDLAYTYGVRTSATGRSGSLTAIFRRLHRALVGKPLELGGALEPLAGHTPPHVVQPTLTFLPPSTLLKAHLNVALGPSLPGPHDQTIEDGTDPVSVLRAAIAEGRAQEAGPTHLDGRKVLRIKFQLPNALHADAPSADAPKIHVEAYADVEPETFHPVEIVFGPWTYRFSTYEYLPATRVNLALTNVRAQHPDAKTVAGEPKRN